MKIEVDARGQACPKPVIMTKKELDKMDKGLVVTIVDNEVAVGNVSKLASSLGYEYKVDRKKEDEYYITIAKGEGETQSEEIKETKKADSHNLVIAFSSYTMGKGSEELGKILIKSFMYTLTESKPYPKTMLFFNSGVYLTCEGSEVLEDLKKLESEGVEIFSCGTCLDYYKLKEKLQVGQITNMYTIYERIKNASNTVSIG